MNPLIAKPLISLIMILMSMVFISLIFIKPGDPEWYIDIISLIILLSLLTVIVYDIRKQVGRRSEEFS